MNKIKTLIMVSATALCAMLIPSVSQAQTPASTPYQEYWGAPPGSLIVSSKIGNSGTNAFSATVTNAYGIWPSAIGGPGAIASIAGSTLLEDITNPVAIPITSQKDLSLEFVATLAGGSGTGAGTNILIRIAYTDQSTTLNQIATNGTASWTPNLQNWFINPTVTNGAGSVDAVINLSTLTNATQNIQLSTSHGHYYIYDIAFLQISNASPYLTNYSLWYNAK